MTDTRILRLQGGYPPSTETTGYCQAVDEGWQGSTPPKATGDWDKVWARVTYDNLQRRRK